jgi:AraC-like DNA-binding protein
MTTGRTRISASDGGVKPEFPVDLIAGRVARAVMASAGPHDAELVASLIRMMRPELEGNLHWTAVIAGDAGYQSETAFSRAYQRQFGVAPGGDRAWP